MKHDALFEQIVSFKNLLHASRKARKGKRGQGNVGRFEVCLEKELLLLQQELVTQAYTPGAYKEFYIYEPKKRMISAAPYRDRVVHHALCNVIVPIFERTFIYDTYANRTGKGTHKAIDRYQKFCRRTQYVLKCDIKKYFPSVDHEILKMLVRKNISCSRTLELIDKIIDASNKQEEAIEYFSEDDLFTPVTRRRGLPIGNLTSQFLANVYLNPLDHFVKERLHCRRYVRYVDDFVLLSDDAKELWRWKHETEQFLEHLRLRMHEGKSRVYRVTDGIEFLGHRIFPEFRLLKKKNIARFRRRLRKIHELYAKGRLSAQDISCRIQSWVAHARHSNTHRLRASILEYAQFIRAEGNVSL